MLTAHQAPDGRFFIAVKGARSEVMAMCTVQTDNGSIIPISEVERADIDDIHCVIVDQHEFTDSCSSTAFHE